MINVKGKELSEGTVVRACEAYGISFDKPKHIFRAGDLAVCCGHPRIIVDVGGILTSYTPSLKEHSVEGQSMFEHYNYKYVCRLSEALRTDIAKL